MTFSNLSVAALSQHLPQVLALPPYDPTAPKAAPVAAPPARTELERLDDALHLFREVCPSLRVVDLQGDANARNRAAIISVIEGRRVPQAKAGFNALRAALFAATHADEEGSLAERTAQFENFALLYLNPPTAEEVAEGVAEIERELAAELEGAALCAQASEVLAPDAEFQAVCRESIEQINRSIDEGRKAADAAPCAACQGKGWDTYVEGEEKGGFSRVFACDACETLATDEEAWEAAAAAGIANFEGHVLHVPSADLSEFVHLSTEGVLTAAPLPAKSEIEPTTAAPAAEVETAPALHVAPPCVTILSDQEGRVLIRYSTPAGYLTAKGEPSPCECVIQIAGGQVDVIMSTAPKAPTYSAEVFPAGDIETLSLYLLSEGGKVPEELYYKPEDGVSLTSPDAPKAKAAKAPAEPKAPKVAKPSAAEERARAKAERAARTASRAAKKGKTRKGK